MHSDRAGRLSEGSIEQPQELLVYPGRNELVSPDRPVLGERYRSTDPVVDRNVVWVSRHPIVIERNNYSDRGPADVFGNLGSHQLQWPHRLESILELWVIDHRHVDHLAGSTPLY